MQPSSHCRIQSYRQATSAFSVRALQGAGYVFPVLFASQDFTTERARARHAVARLHASRPVSVGSCLWSDVRPFGLRALRQGGAWEASLAEYQQGVTDLALGGERAEPPAVSLGGRTRRRFL
jgi:hypothetical protein